MCLVGSNFVRVSSRPMCANGPPALLHLNVQHMGTATLSMLALRASSHLLTTTLDCRTCHSVVGYLHVRTDTTASSCICLYSVPWPVGVHRCNHALKTMGLTRKQKKNERAMSTRLALYNHQERAHTDCGATATATPHKTSM